MSFYPLNPRWNRSVDVICGISMVFCLSYGILINDFGPQEHIFSTPRRYLLPKVDSFFGLTEQQIIDMKIDENAENYIKTFSKDKRHEELARKYNIDIKKELQSSKDTKTS